MSQNTKSVLITGGTGYIGSHVAKCLKQAGWTVSVIDLVRRPHVDKFIDNFYCVDYGSVEAGEYIKNNRFDAIVHCAGTSLVGPSVIDPATYYENNVAKSIGFFNHVKNLMNKPVIVFSSSAAVYGQPTTMPIHEGVQKQPSNPYGQTKLIIEHILNDYSRAYGVKSASLRYFNACGADLDGELGQEKGATHIIARLLESKINNESFSLFGQNFDTPDGTCVRDYIHVQDLAEAHKLALEYLLKGGNTFVANLGTNKGLSNREIIDAAIKHVGDIKVNNLPARPGDPAMLIADPSYANILLKWKAEYSDIDTIVSSAWKWYNKG